MKGLNKRFDNILRAPKHPQSSYSRLQLSKNIKRDKGKRLDHMLQIYCKSGFPDKEGEVIEGKIKSL